MTELTDETKEAIREHANEEYPFECCGVVVQKVGGQEYIRGTNTASNPRYEFELDAYSLTAQLQYKHKVLYLVHSHTSKQPDASDADLAAIRESDIPWCIYCIPLDHFNYYTPESTPVLPYEERPWKWGVLDCFTLVRDVYQQELALSIPNQVRPDTEEGMDLESWKGYEPEVERQGFTWIPRPSQKYDLILMAFGSDPLKATHAAVYWDPEMNTMLHHLNDRLSSFGVYGGYWERNTVSVWRPPNA